MHQLAAQSGLATIAGASAGRAYARSRCGLQQGRRRLTAAQCYKARIDESDCLRSPGMDVTMMRWSEGAACPEGRSACSRCLRLYALFSTLRSLNSLCQAFAQP